MLTQNWNKMFCNCFQVICVHDVSSVYRVPLLLEDQGVVSYFCQRLSLPVEVRPRKMLSKWKVMADRWGSLSLLLCFSNCVSCKENGTQIIYLLQSVKSLRHKPKYQMFLSHYITLWRLNHWTLNCSLSSFKVLIKWCSTVNPLPSLLRSARLLEHVSIALVGKYTKLADSYTSVIKALEHSALAINHKLEVKVWKHFTFLCFIYWFLDFSTLQFVLTICHRTLLILT